MLKSNIILRLSKILFPIYISKIGYTIYAHLKYYISLCKYYFKTLFLL